MWARQERKFNIQYSVLKKCASTVIYFFLNPNLCPLLSAIRFLLPTPILAVMHRLSLPSHIRYVCLKVMIIKWLMLLLISVQKEEKPPEEKHPKNVRHSFFSFLISQKKGLKTSKTSLNCTHWLLLLVSLLGITRQFQRWCWYWWRFVCLMLNPQPHPCCLWSPIVDSQKWGCESEFLSYKVLSSRKSKHNIPSSGLLWNHSTKDTSQRGPLSLFID